MNDSFPPIINVPDPRIKIENFCYCFGLLVPPSYWHDEQQSVDNDMLSLEEKGDLVLVIPDQCNHCFHEECLMKWAKVENSCPTCRKRFSKIGKYVPRVDFQKFKQEMINRNCALEELEELFDLDHLEDKSLQLFLANHVIDLKFLGIFEVGHKDQLTTRREEAVTRSCTVCQTATASEEMLKCSGNSGRCTAGSHWFCLEYYEMPLGLPWYCERCILLDRCNGLIEHEVRIKENTNTVRKRQLHLSKGLSPFPEPQGEIINLIPASLMPKRRNNTRYEVYKAKKAVKKKDVEVLRWIDDTESVNILNTACGLVKQPKKPLPRSIIDNLMDEGCEVQAAVVPNLRAPRKISSHQKVPVLYKSSRNIKKVMQLLRAEDPDIWKKDMTKKQQIFGNKIPEINKPDKTPNEDPLEKLFHRNLQSSKKRKKLVIDLDDD